MPRPGTTTVRLAAQLLLAGANLLTGQTATFHRFATAETGRTQKLVFDGRRARMVRVESSAFSGGFATWEWVHGGWSLRHTVTTPPPRSDFALGYDEARQRIVLFGGRTAVSSVPQPYLDDTWQYDGIDWVQLQPVQRPTAQGFGWLGQDHATGKLFLCGGMNNSATYAAWHFDGVTWTQAPVAFTSNVTGGFASDPIRQRVVGYSPAVTGNLMCEWDGTAWSWVTAAAWPTPRATTTMTWVSSLQRIVLHGGAGNPNPGDLWGYDGSTWTLLGPAPVRSWQTIAHDPVRDVLFVVGGRTTGALSVDTLQYAGSVWSSHGSGIGWEDLRGAWFDWHRQRVVALSMAPLDWLEWDGSAWSRQPSPVALVNPRGTFDLVRNRTVVVGSNPAGVVTQEWDGIGAWTSPVVAGLPFPARPTFHPGRLKVVASCGSAGVFEWNGSAWSLFAPGPGGPWTAVADAECVFDAARNELVQVQWSGANCVTARLNGTTWNVSSSTAGPAPRVDAAFAYDPQAQRAMLFGGKSGSGASAVSLGDLWSWDGATWTQQQPAILPAPRSRGVLLFDDSRQQMVLWGGERVISTTGSVPCTDSWALDARPDHDVRTIGPGCSGTVAPLALVPGVPHAGATHLAIEAHGPFPQTPGLFGFSFAAGAVPVGHGCTQWLVAQEALVLVMFDAAGVATVTGGLSLAWHGTSWVAQAAVLDPSNPLGVTLSDGVQLTAGF